ncbi:hypothetical protein RZ71_01140 [Apilactobacillus kunkeei]|uniref:Surface layer protein A domain-containing protein n=1 Tax=Apilactobacillus kunkeei TaxID=148814 RepID=A0A0M9DBY1_9LACO|nr:hypothetical protein [Apilactobacillus kunkeei]KOY75696.1 hypothetical protein RZ71_01140 [Apilactobacillus kunkeei]
MNKTLMTTMAAGAVFGVGVVATQGAQAHADAKSDIQAAQNKVNAAKAKVEKLSKGTKVTEVQGGIPADLQKQINDAQNKVNNVQHTLDAANGDMQYYQNQKVILQKKLDDATAKMNSLSDNDPAHQQAMVDFYSAQYDMQDNDGQITNADGWIGSYKIDLQNAKNALSALQDKAKNYGGKTVTVKKVDQAALAAAKKEYQDAVKELKDAKAGKAKWKIPATGGHNKYTKKKATKKHTAKKAVKKAKQLFKIDVKANKVYSYKTIALHKAGRKLEKKGTKLPVYKIVKKGHKEFYLIKGNRVITANKHDVMKIK